MKRAKSRMKNYTIVADAPDGRIYRFTVPKQLAWATARGIVADTHYGCVIQGEYGNATFHSDGTGQVKWNEKSATPTEATGFGRNTTVAI